MKIFFYTLRPYDELDYCEQLRQKTGIDYAWTVDAPNPGNLRLAQGCDAVSTNPCTMTPEYLEAFAQMGVKYLPCRSITTTTSRSTPPSGWACACHTAITRPRASPTIPSCSC